MFTYEQKSARLRGNEIDAPCYSGKGIGRNNPLLQETRALGPIPVGKYTIGPPQDTPTHGPYVLRLTPAPDNKMWGRSGFLIHGDNTRHDASLGCIITDRATREAVWKSGDRGLEVVSGL